MKKLSKSLFFIFHYLLFTFSFHSLFSQRHTENFRMILHDDWRMQSLVTDSSLTGPKVSEKNFPAKGWYKITVPTTIIGGLLANNEYKFDPFYSKNFEKLADSRLDKTWWFRKEFELPVSEKNKNVVLRKSLLYAAKFRAACRTAKRTGPPSQKS